MIVPVVFLVCMLTAPASQQGAAPSGGDSSAKAQPNGDPAPPPANPDDIPVSIKRIQRALESPPAIKVLDPTMRNGRPVYRVEIEADKVDLQAILGKDYLRGVASYGGMTHQEFLDLVTPNDVKGYAAFSNAEGVTVAATSIALKWAVLKALDAMKKAKDEREQEQARKEVEAALEALRQARRAAGLPDK
jgi:hypothetical protein